MAIGFMMAVVALSATWVYLDARRLGVERGLVSGLTDMGPVGWSASVALLWVLAYPLYLSRRHRLSAAVEQRGRRPLDDDRRRRLVVWAWVVYSVVVLVSALLASSNLLFGESLYCTVVWDLSGGGTASFGVWPFGPTCTFLYGGPVRTFEPGSLWSALFFYWVGSTLLLVTSATRSRVPSGPAGSAEPVA